MKFKKITFLSLIIAFAFWILGVSVAKTLATENQPASSKNYKVNTVDVTPAPSVEIAAEESTVSAVKKEIDYFLVYPGILPDHFLYPIKMMRDRIQLWLTTDHLAKGELMLKYADKRLGAGKALIEGNKVELGITTLTKGEKYLQQAISQGELANKEEAKDFFKKLAQASLKHEEVLLVLNEKIDSSSRPMMEKIIELVRQNQQQIKQNQL